MNERIDWSKFAAVGLPSILKVDLLKPYFERAEVMGAVLDAGCGDGFFSKLLCRRGYKVVGVDLNSQIESDERFNFQKIDFLDYHTTQKFESILLINVLTTVPGNERLKMLEQIKKFKTAEGIAYVSIPNADLLKSDFQSKNLESTRIDDQKIRLKVRLINGDHLEFEDYLVDHAEMIRMAERVGLKIINKIEFQSSDLPKPYYILYLLR